MASQRPRGRPVAAAGADPREPAGPIGGCGARAAASRGGGLRGWAAAARRRRRPRRRADLIFLVTVGAWVAFDQITKAIVRVSLEQGEHWELVSFFRISHITNSGAAFGLFSDMNALLAVAAAVAIVVLAVYTFSPAAEHGLARLGLALIMAGAIGNLLDRLYQGNVTDFLDFRHFPAFNVADAGINLGVVALLLYALAGAPSRRAPPREAE